MFRIRNVFLQDVAIDATWQHFETTLSVTKQGYLDVFVGGTHAPSACVILDDVTVRRLN